MKPYILLIALILALALGASLAGRADAGEQVLLYSTNTASGTENSGVVKVEGPAVLVAGSFLNYSTTAEVVMIFDATALPANGAIPRISLTVPAAGSSVSPGQAGITLGRGGAKFQNGIVYGCSTTGKTLTIDTTSGGNCFAEIGYQ